ncbi:MAG TPA: hypothetical protein VE968_09215 [Sphingomicrobium sp.]|nr:hypothetical protein [Sphingomicrobium sp.]
MVKLLVLVMLAGALADALFVRAEPPLLIDSSSSPPALDGHG